MGIRSTLELFVERGSTQPITSLVPMGFLPGGRLTLTTAVPVTTADVVGATTLYYTPYLHNTIQLWEPRRRQWVTVTFAETALVLTGSLTTGTLYDVTASITPATGALRLTLYVWATTTTRTTPLISADGRVVIDATAKEVYLGTFWATSSGTTEDSGGGVTNQVGGNRFLWNMYHRRPRHLAVIDTTSTWSYKTHTWRGANNVDANSVQFVQGIAEDEVAASIVSAVSLDGNTANAASVGIWLDSSGPVGLFSDAFNASASGNHFTMTASYRGIPGIGYHILYWIESGAEGNNCNFLGAGFGFAQSGLHAVVYG